MQAQLRMTEEEKEAAKRRIWDNKVDKKLEAVFGTSDFVDYNKLLANIPN
jgi:hypothetical protein